MIVVKTFVSELNKKIDMLHAQIEQFEKKVKEVHEITTIIEKTTLKDIKDINGDDISLINEDDFKTIIDVVKFNNSNKILENFIKNAVTNKLYAKLFLEGKADEELTKKAEEAKKWLDEHANNIKEFILEFKESNESYLISLKNSDNLYKKYLDFFAGEELVKPLTNFKEFNDLLKKSGLIMSEKWQLLKYIAQKNIEFSNNTLETDMMEEIKKLLDEEKDLLKGIDEEKLNFCISLIDMPESEVKKLNLKSEDLIKYQKIPILNNIQVLYEETIKLIEENKESNNKQIEKNKKELKAFKSSYEFFQNLN